MTTTPPPSDFLFSGGASYGQPNTKATLTPADIFSTFHTPTVTPTVYGALPSAGFPFAFPVVTDQGSFYSSVNSVLFSYYYPDLIVTDPVKYSANCHSDNYLYDVSGVVLGCKNTTASGQGWHEYMRKGLAVHPDMLSKLPFGSVLYVASPSSIAGYYTVVDLCGGCLINGSYYFDFLFSDMPSDLNWSMPVSYGVVRIGWFGQLPTVTPYVYSTLTLVPSVTPTPTFTEFPTNIPTDLPSVTPTPTFMDFPTDFPSFTPTPTFTDFPTDLPSVTPIPSVTPTFEAIQ